MRQELADEDTYSIGVIPRAEIFEIWESPANPIHIQKSLSTGATALGAPPAELSSPVTTQLVTVIYSSLKSQVKYVLQKAGQKPIAKQHGGSEVILQNHLRVLQDRGRRCQGTEARSRTGEDPWKFLAFLGVFPGIFVP